MGKFRLLFVDFDLPFFLKGDEYPFGGACVRQYALAKGIVSLGHEVGILTWKGAINYVGKSFDFELVESYALSEGGQKLRWFYHIYPALYRAVKSYRPDFLLQKCCGKMTGVMAFISKQLGIPFIYIAANDMDADGRYKDRLRYSDYRLYEYGVKNAAKIIVQNEYQRREFRKWPAAGDVYTVHNPFWYEGALPAIKPLPDRKYVAWAGVFQGQKNLPALLKIIEGSPDMEFRIAGTFSNDCPDDIKRVVREIAAHNNVRMMGFVDRSSIIPFLADAVALLNTSHYEGFSNTFLESFAAGTPVVTTQIDPDNIIAGNRLGIVTQNYNEVPARLDELRRRSDYTELAERCRDYVLKKHHPVKIAEIFMESIAGDRIRPERIIQPEKMKCDHPAEKIKICYIIGQLGKGGAERQLYELVKGIDRKRFHPVVISLSKGGAWKDDIQKLDVEVIELQRKKSLEFKRLLKLFRLLKSIGPDIVHTFLFPANSYGRIAAILARVPVVVASERNSVEAGNDKSRVRIYIDKLLAPFSRGIICNTHEAAESLINNHSFDREKVFAVHNGIDVAKYRKNGPGGRNNCLPKVIGTVGRLYPQKNHRLFLEMAKIISEKHGHEDLKFMIVGEGPLKNELKAYCCELGIESNVIFTGWTDNVRGVLHTMEVFVLSSDWEGLPNVVMEAMASALPCVVTDVGGNPELVVHGVTGYVVPANDPGAMARKVSYFLENQDAAREMGEKGRKRMEEEFDTAKMVEETEVIYKKLMSATRCVIPDKSGIRTADGRTVTPADSKSSPQ